ncbi:MAG: sigma-70 family RNA polymerase sigma factor [Longimicrobiaceae bacterium]
MALTAEDRNWFEREVRYALPDLYGTALRLARDPADAEDLVSEAVTKALCNLASLNDRARFRGWIFRILTNTFISEHRARAALPVAEPYVEEDGEQGEGFSLFERLHQPFLLWWGNPEQQFLNRLLREDLEKAVDGLPEAFRLVVVLADLQGCSYQEIAETLEIPIGTVRSRLARGRGLLQEALWEHAKDAGLVH